MKYRPPGRRLRHRVHPPSLQAGRSAGFPLLAGAPRRHRVAEASPSRSLAAARVHRDAPLHPRQVRSPAIHSLSVAGALPSCCAPCVARRSAARGSSTHATLAMGVASAPTTRAALLQWRLRSSACARKLRPWPCTRAASSPCFLIGDEMKWVRDSSGKPRRGAVTHQPREVEKRGRTSGRGAARPWPLAKQPCVAAASNWIQDRGDK